MTRENHEKDPARRLILDLVERALAESPRLSFHAEQLHDVVRRELDRGNSYHSALTSPLAKATLKTLCAELPGVLEAA